MVGVAFSALIGAGVASAQQVQSSGDVVVLDSALTGSFSAPPPSGPSWLLPTDRLHVGNHSPGTLSITAGGTVLSDAGYVGYDGPGDAFVSGTGSSWTNTNMLTLGNYAGSSGRLTVQDGGAVISALGLVGFGGDGTAVVDGANSSWIIGPGIPAGYRELYVGYQDNSRGNVTLRDGGRIELPDGTVYLGLYDNSRGVLNFGAASGAAAVAAGRVEAGVVVLGYDATASGRVVFNHTGMPVTGDALLFTPVLYGERAEILNENGTTILTADSPGFRGQTIVTGGNLQLASGAWLGGTADVAGGKFSVDGTFTGEVSVSSGGTLGGTGTIGRTTIQSGGTLGAGASVGTITVESLTMGAGAVLDVELNAGGNVAGINNDLVVVTGATVIDPTASVSVRPSNGADTGVNYAPNTRYTILTAAGGRTGTFASVADQFAFMDASLDYDANTVYLILARNKLGMSEVAQTPNQRAAASALSGFSAGDPVMAALLNATNGEARRAFALSSGDANASAHLVIDRSFALFASSLNAKGHQENGSVLSLIDAGAGQIGSGFASEEVVSPIHVGSFWIAPLVGSGTLASDGNGPTADWSAGGLAAGYERRTVLAGGDAVLGLGMGYLNTAATVPSRLASTDAQGGNLGAYGAWTNGAAVVSGKLAIGASHVTSSRDLAFGGINRTAAADYWVKNIGLELEAGYGFALTDTLSVGPVSGMELSWSGHDGFAENGAGTLNATVAPTNLVAVNSALGIAMAYQLEGDAGAFSIKGRALWLHNWGDNAVRPDITLAGGGAPFQVASPATGRDRLEIGTGLAFKAAETLDVSLDYTGRFFGGQTEHTVTGSLTIKF